MRTETISQEFSAAAIVLLAAVVVLGLLGMFLQIAAGAGIGLWFAGLWCNMRGV